MRTIPGYDNFKVDDGNRRVFINGAWYDFGDIVDYELRTESHKESHPIYKGGKGRLTHSTWAGVGIVAESIFKKFDFDDYLSDTYTILITINSFDTPEEILCFDEDSSTAQKVERLLKIILKQNG